MNKNIFKAALLAAFALPVLSSCELDQEPETNITYESSWGESEDPYEDACKHYTGMMTVVRAVVGGSNAYVSEAMTDLFNLRAGALTLDKEHRWTFTTNQFAGDIIWANNFSLVMQANDFIANIDPFINEEKSKEEAATAAEKAAEEAGDAEEKDTQTKLKMKYQERKERLMHYKGVAYFARAYAYCNMIVRYCKDYEPETAADELGLPIVTTVDKDARPARASLQETVAFIQSDFANAEANMQAFAAYDNTNNLYHPGTDALDALEMRFALYTHDFDTAIEKADYIIANYPLASSEQEMEQLWVFDSGSEIIFEPAQTPEEHANSYLGMYISYDIREIDGSPEIYGYSPELVPTQGVVDLYEPGDLRIKAYFSNPYLGEAAGVTKLSNSSSDEPAHSAYLLFKYPGNQKLFKNDWDWYSSPYNMSKAFRSAEAYLTAAEAYLRKPNPDEAKARKYLNDLRLARGTFDWDATTTGEELVKEMENEWVREYLGEGFRLDCLKRWHKGFKRMEAQNMDGLKLLLGQDREDKSDVDGYKYLEIKPDNFRFVWEIPMQDLQSNPNLKRNWQ